MKVSVFFLLLGMTLTYEAFTSGINHPLQCLRCKLVAEEMVLFGSREVEEKFYALNQMNTHSTIHESLRFAFLANKLKQTEMMVQNSTVVSDLGVDDFLLLHLNIKQLKDQTRVNYGSLYLLNGLLRLNYVQLVTYNSFNQFLIHLGKSFKPICFILNELMGKDIYKKVEKFFSLKNTSKFSVICFKKK